MSVVAGIFIAIVVIFVTAFLFIGWIGVTIIRAIVGLAKPAVPPRLARVMKERFTSRPGQMRCSRETCRNFNPPAARFCRCCGAVLEAQPAKWQIRRPIQKRMWA